MSMTNGSTYCTVGTLKLQLAAPQTTYDSAGDHMTSSEKKN